MRYMEYTLMHKNVPVVDLVIDDEISYITKIQDMHDIRNLPPGIAVNGTGIEHKSLHDWWTRRSIPKSRMGLRDALETIGLYSPHYLIEKCLALSLTDKYWICPKNSGLKWETVNFYDNGFSKDMGEILFGREITAAEHINLMSPDNTTDGQLRKKWIAADGKQVLMKSGSGVMQQEPFNEVTACAIMRRLNIPHVDYTLTFDNGKPYSLCENFITPDTEFIPARDIIEAFKKDGCDYNLTHLLRSCESLGISGVNSATDKMLTLDYIIANEDRHYNNFGFIRNAETLEWLGLAPVFDSGTSLWYNTARVGSLTESKPFKKTHGEQIKLVNDLSWFDYKALNGLADEIVKIFEASENVDETRSQRIAESVMARAKQIQE